MEKDAIFTHVDYHIFGQSYYSIISVLDAKIMQFLMDLNRLHAAVKCILFPNILVIALTYITLHSKSLFESRKRISAVPNVVKYQCFRSVSVHSLSGIFCIDSGQRLLCYTALLTITVSIIQVSCLEHKVNFRQLALSV